MPLLRFSLGLARFFLGGNPLQLVIVVVTDLLDAGVYPAADLKFAPSPTRTAAIEVQEGRGV
jgi:hypothetical protein